MFVYLLKPKVKPGMSTNIWFITNFASKHNCFVLEPSVLKTKQFKSVPVKLLLLFHTLYSTWVYFHYLFFFSVSGKTSLIFYLSWIAEKEFQLGLISTLFREKVNRLWNCLHFHGDPGVYSAICIVH